MLDPVEELLAELPEEVGAISRALRRLVRDTLPGAHAKRSAARPAAPAGRRARQPVASPPRRC